MGMMHIAAPLLLTALAAGRAEPVGIDRLVRAYPGALCGAEGNAVLWCDGSRMIFDDGLPKSFEQKLDDADLQDQMSIPYPAPDPAAPDADPGRIRCRAFFEKMYGASPKAVAANLEAIAWLPGVADLRVSVTRVNRVAGRLSAISSEVLRLERRVIERVRIAGGGYAARRIAGTRRPSPHSWGIAIDVGVRRSRYWRWDRAGLRELGRRFDDIPEAVVRIFERHGFIWGGRWRHYDTMHFEYRPELLPRALPPLRDRASTAPGS